MQLVRKGLERARHNVAAMAQQAETREPMTKAQKLEVFGGPNGCNREAVKQFLDLLDKLKK